MSLDQGSPEPAATPGSAGPAGPPPPGGPYVAPPAQTTSGVAVAGFILAFLIAPLGLILSIIGAATAGKRGQKGKGLAVAGIVISLLIMAGAAAVGFAAYQTVSKVTDPGCVAGKNILLNPGTPDSPEKFQALVDGLNAASAKADRPEVATAMKNLATDYQTLFQEAQAGTNDPTLTSKITADGAAIDKVCTINVGK